MLKTGAVGAVLAAFPFACGERPLPDEQAAGGEGGTSGTAGGTGGAVSGEGGARNLGGGAGGGGAGGSVGGGAGGSVGGTGSGTTCSPGLSAGSAATIALGTLSIVGARMVLGRDAGGLYAMSAFCTHQGCLVGVVGAPGQQALSCPCHGSAFDGNGAVTRGPARTALAHYRVDLTADGAATICAAVTVASSARTPLP